MELEEADTLLKEKVTKVDTPIKEENPTKSLNQAKEFFSKENKVVINGIHGSV